MSTSVYDWPAALPSADFLASPNNQVVITLSSVPVQVYNLGTAYIKLGLKFRDITGDDGARRRILGGASSSSRSLQTMEANSAEMVAKVEFATESDGSISAKVSFMAFSAIATGTALLI